MLIQPKPEHVIIFRISESSECLAWIATNLETTKTECIERYLNIRNFRPFCGSTILPVMRQFPVQIRVLFLLPLAERNLSHCDSNQDREDWIRLALLTSFVCSHKKGKLTEVYGCQSFSRVHIRFPLHHCLHSSGIYELQEPICSNYFW